MCSTIPPPPKWPHVSDFFEPSIFGMPQPMPFTRTCLWLNWSQWLKASRPPSVLHYPPPPKKKAPCFSFFLNQAYLECPNLYLSPEPVFGRIGHNGSEIQVVKVCSAIRPRPPKRPHVSDFFLNQAYLEYPNLYLSREPVFGRIGHNGSEIQGLQVCSTIRPRQKAPCFRFFLNQACANLCLSPKPVFGRIGHHGSEIQVLKVCSTSRRRKASHVSDFLNPAYLECPNLCLSPELVFGRIGHNGLEIDGLKEC